MQTQKTAYLAISRASHELALRLVAFVCRLYAANYPFGNKAAVLLARENLGSVFFFCVHLLRVVPAIRCEGLEMSDDGHDGEESALFAVRKPTRSAAEIDAADKQIVTQLKDVRYVVREYPTEVVVQKYLKGRGTDENEVYVPDYQRELIWPERHKSRFIESLLIGLPIPFLFVADVG